MDDRVAEFLLDEVESLRDELARERSPVGRRRALEAALQVVGHHPSIPDRPIERKDLETLASCAQAAVEIYRTNGDDQRLLHVAYHDVPRLLAEVDRLMRLDSDRRSGREILEGPVHDLDAGSYRPVFDHGELRIERTDTGGAVLRVHDE